MPTFKVTGEIGVSLDGVTFIKGQTFEADPKRMERSLKRGIVEKVESSEKELKEPKSTKELKAKKQTK